MMATKTIFHIWRFSERKCALMIPETVLDEIKRMAVCALPNETGGTLVGHYSQNRRRAYVKKVLGVKKSGHRGRFWFFRPPDNVDTQLAEIYCKSKGTTYYLGEWHTHPGSRPDPSQTDLETLRSLARSASVATDTPVLLILGGDLKENSMISCTLADASGKIYRGNYRKMLYGSMR